MFRVLIAGILFGFLSCSLAGQEVKVYSKVTGKPVENVALFNRSRTIVQNTNDEGIVSVHHFTDDDTIYFQHTAFEPVAYTKAYLQEANHAVYLERRIMMLDEFVVSAHKWEQDKREVPVRINTIHLEEVKLGNPQTAADLLGTSGEVFIQKSQMGGGSPMIRGFAANSVLLVVDGVRMNNAIYRSGNLQNVLSLDPHTIESSEIIFGPGSVIYGSDAMGGVMDFHTGKPLLATSQKNLFKLNTLVRYSSANREKTAHLDFNTGFRNWGLLTSFSYSDYDDLKMGSRKNPSYTRQEYVARINGVDSIIRNPDPDVQRYSAYDQVNFMQKIRYKPNENFDLLYTFQYSRLSDVPRYDRLIQYRNNILRYAEWYYGPQKWVLNSLMLETGKPTTLYDDLRIILAQQVYEESRHDRKYREDVIRHRTEKVGIMSINIDFTKKTTRGASLFYGLETVLNNVQSTACSSDLTTGINSPLDTRYPDGTNHYTTAAGYLSLKKSFSEKITVQAGGRYSYINLFSTIEDTSFFHLPFTRIELTNGALNGSLGLVYLPSLTWQVNLNASSGFRAPNLDDVGKIFESEPGNVVVPNRNLRPEYIYNLDLGLVKKFKDLVRVELTGFYSLLTNVMVRRDFLFNGHDSITYDGELSKVEAVVNEDRAILYGASFSILAYVTPRITFRSNLSYTFGETDEKIPMTHIAPLFGSTHLMYKKGGLTMDFFAEYNGEKPFKLFDPAEIAQPEIYATDKNGNPYSPSWYTLNIKTSYVLKKWCELGIGVENILDHRYRPFSSGIVAPGRNFILSLRLLK